MPSASPVGDPSIALPTASPSNRARRASLKVLSRNIDKVVLGNVRFRTWYYSPYPDNIILGEDHISGHSDATTAGLGPATKHHPHHKPAYTTVNGEVDGPFEQAKSAMTTSTLLKSSNKPCECLHVCPYCFRYTPKADSYVQHLKRHTVTYNPHSSSSSKSSDQRSENGEATSDTSTEEDTSTWPVPATAVKVYEHGGYTVWDVDGEREKLYCQNLSLFGKLFLEQKSVFFDTGGFHYFVLTYTPPPPTMMATTTTMTEPHKRSTATGPSRAVGRRRTSSATTPRDAIPRTMSLASTLLPDSSLRTHVLGFFSKENLSWDANNLACILVFPPYQHRNLGQLLMAVSYKLSGWEWEDSIIGGPEKPLSSMGRRSYLRFWSERVARFMMGQTADADGRTVFDGLGGINDDDRNGDSKGKRKRKKTGFSREEMTVKEIGDRTGMLAEDVVAALNEMGVLEVMPPPSPGTTDKTGKQKKKRKSNDGDGDGSSNMGVSTETGDEQRQTMLQTTSSMIVHRSKVLNWAKQKGVDLVSPVREEGFLGEWALSEVEDDDEDIDDEENTEQDEEEVEESE